MTAPAGWSEATFRRWYAARAARLGLDPDPDARLHFYDYRAAYRAGAEPDASGHWPSEFKREGHPNLIVDGRDTRTGERVAERRMKPPRRYNTRGLEQAEEKSQPGAGGLHTGRSGEERGWAGRYVRQQRLHRGEYPVPPEGSVPKEGLKPGGPRGHVLGRLFRHLREARERKEF